MPYYGLITVLVLPRRTPSLCFGTDGPHPFPPPEARWPMKPVLTTAAYDLPLPVTSSLLGGTLDCPLVYPSSLGNGKDKIN